MKKNHAQKLNNLIGKALIVGVCLFAEQKANAVKINSYADIAEEAVKGVVNIRTKTFVKRDPALDIYQFFMNGSMPKTKNSSSLGTGIIYNSEGLIVTNYHVIKNASEIEVYFSKKKKAVNAKVIGVDIKTDLAVLKINPPKKLRKLEFGNSDRLRIGDVVLAIGNPFGFSHTVTSGIISAKGRVIGSGPYDNFLQTDASIHPGNSGGPLLDTRGRVIGINTAVSQEGQGIGFAIPSNLAKSIIADLVKHGKVIRPWLGIVGENIISAEAHKREYQQSSIYGVIVSNLVVDGPGQKAGLRIGDLILEVSGNKIQDTYELQRLVSDKSPAEVISLKVYRRNKGFVNLNLGLEVVPDNRNLPSDADLL
jgi:serine protease Do